MIALKLLNKALETADGNFLIPASKIELDEAIEELEELENKKCESCTTLHTKNRATTVCIHKLIIIDQRTKNETHNNNFSSTTNRL